MRVTDVREDGWKHLTGVLLLDHYLDVSDGGGVVRDLRGGGAGMEDSAHGDGA